MSKTQKIKDEIAKKIKKNQKVSHKGIIKQTFVSKDKSLSQNMKWIRLSNTLNRFKAAIKAFRLSDDSSKSNSKQSNMSNKIQILNGVKTMYSHTLLSCLLETCIVTFDFCSQCVNFLKRNTVTVNGKFVIIGKSNIFGASSIFLAIIPAFVIAQTAFVFRLFQWAAVFLPGSVIVKSIRISWR